MGVGFLVAGLICLPTGIALGLFRIKNWYRHVTETQPFEIPFSIPFGPHTSIPWGSRYHKWLYIGSAFGFGVAGLGFILIGGAAVLNYIKF